MTSSSRWQVLSDEQWARIEPLLPSNKGRQGHPFGEDRPLVEGIIYLTKSDQEFYWTYVAGRKGWF